jgi:anti-sigma B factor antagonist
MTSEQFPTDVPHDRSASGPDGPPEQGSASAAPLSVTAHRAGGAEVLVVAGEVDMANATQLRSEVYRCLAEQPAVLVLDLTAVTFLDSSGLTVLVEAHQAAAPHTALRVVADQRVVLRPIQITELDRVLTVYASVDHALTPD